ncbi:MAG: sensor histidine kinase [Cytophagales bacterium]
MSRLALRIVIALAVVSILGIAITQIYWVRKAFDLKENQFNNDVNRALESVATRIFGYNKMVLPASKIVDQVSTNYFVVLLNGPIDSNLLGYLIKTEFDKRKITTDYQYGVYDCADQCMVGGNYYAPTKNSSRQNTNTPSGPHQTSLTDLPTTQTDGYYFGVRFFNIEANLVSQMGIWVFSSSVLLIVIFFFAYALFVILKQRRLSEVQKDFINNMTHEFKTPLSTIAISSGVLKDPSIIQTPERLLNYATIIENETHRLKQQVERVLQMARWEKNSFTLKREPLSLHQIISESVKSNLFAVEKAGCTVQLQLNASDDVLPVDKLHLSNVLYNLIDNAVKYCQQQPVITISTESTSHVFTLAVADNGIGISNENHTKIFHRFYRVPTGNVHDVKGFGLGLNYVKLVVEAHGGRITVQSKIGNGSIFKIVLPLT